MGNGNWVLLSSLFFAITVTLIVGFVLWLKLNQRITQRRQEESFLKVVQSCNGGVFKRIEENKLLLDFLHADPLFKEEFGEVEGWVTHQEEFFVALSGLLSPVDVQKK